MSLTIEATVGLGLTIDEIALEAQRLSDQLGANLRFRYNGYWFIAVPGGSAAELLRRFHTERHEGVISSAIQKGKPL